MTLNSSKIKGKAGNSKFAPAEPLEPGTYPSRLVQVIDLGVQEQRPYKGEAKDPVHMIYTTYELADEFMKDEEGNDVADKPRWMSEDFPLYGLDADLAKSTKRYLALDPLKKFGGDWSLLPNSPAMLTLIQKPSKDKTKVFNNITGVSSMRDKDAARLPELKNPPKVFSLDEPDMEIFKSLPEWLQDRIKGNLDYDGSELQNLVEGQGEASKEKPVGDTKKEPKASVEPSEDEVEW